MPKKPKVDIINPNPRITVTKSILNKGKFAKKGHVFFTAKLGKDSLIEEVPTSSYNFSPLSELAFKGGLAKRFEEQLKQKHLKQKNMENEQLAFNPEYLERIARVCHEANRSICLSVGDDSQRSWEEAEQWQKDSAMKGVAFRINNPDSPESAQHDAWSADKIKDGWVYGEEKDTELKTHPCLVPFEDLPVYQQRKDKVFCGIVDLLK